MFFARCYLQDLVQCSIQDLKDNYCGYNKGNVVNFKGKSFESKTADRGEKEGV